MNLITLKYETILQPSVNQNIKPFDSYYFYVTVIQILCFVSSFQILTVRRTKFMNFYLQNNLLFFRFRGILSKLKC